MKKLFYLFGSLFIFSVNCDDYITGKDDQTIFDDAEEDKPISNTSDEDQTMLDILESDCEVKININNTTYVNCEDKNLSGIKVTIINLINISLPNC